MCGSRAKLKTADEVASKGESTGVDESQSTGLVTVSVEHVHGSLASLVIILVFLFVAWLVWRYLKKRDAVSPVSSSPPSSTPSCPESVRVDAAYYAGANRVMVPSLSYKIDGDVGVVPARPSIQWSPSWQPASFAE